MSKTINFNFDYYEHKRRFRKPSIKEKEMIKEKLEHYTNCGYDNFLIGKAKPSVWNEYNNWKNTHPYQ